MSTRARAGQNPAEGEKQPNGVPPLVRQTLSQPGRSLDSKTRHSMEARLGHSFNQVRIHTDPQAAASAQAVSARAYTVGHNVVFAPGQFAPGTPAGDRVLAHELAHVVQQSGSPVSGHLPAAQSPALEAEAHAAARGGGTAALSQGTGLRLARWDSFEHVQLGNQAGGPGSSELTVLQCHDIDFPERHDQSQQSWPEKWKTRWTAWNDEQKRAATKGLKYGEIVALSGDFYRGWEALNRAPLEEVIELIPLIQTEGDHTDALQRATGGRYLELARDNQEHFSSGPEGTRNIDVWKRMHEDAIKAAMRGDKNAAWGINAAADHYLTDAFAGGHIRTPRAELQGSLSADMESRVLHNLDNKHGVRVASEAHPKPYIAYGDNAMVDNHGNDENRAQAMEAIKASQQDIAQALALRDRYSPPAQFRALTLIPKAVNPGEDRWTGRMPTYVHTARGSFRKRDDYTDMQAFVVGEGLGAAPSVVTDGDNVVRDWVTKHQSMLSRQSLDDRKRMMGELLSSMSVITEDDVKAIVAIARASTREERAFLYRTFHKQIHSVVRPDYFGAIRAAFVAV